MVHEGTADLGFIEGEVDDPALSINPVAEDELVLVVSPDHPWAKHRPDPSSALKSGRWIFREHGSGTRSIFEAALPGFGVKPQTRSLLSFPRTKRFARPSKLAQA
jgi:DNA-binding transcriptional LysR family regulator